MNNTYKIIGGLAICGAIFLGLNTLLNFTNPVGETTGSTGGGAAKYEGKQDIKHSPYFATPDIYNLQPNENLLILPKFKTRQQITGYTCAPAAAAMVVEHFLGKPLHSEMEMAKIMHTNNINGTTIQGIAKYFKELDWKVKSSATEDAPSKFTFFSKWVQSNLRDNTPIIVENVEWGGHYRVIIGYDTMGTQYSGDDVLIMADPFDLADHVQDGYNIENAQKFYYMWFDHQLYSKSEQNKIWLTAKPK
ncbi:MAG: C39 family peptidase [Phascolarctobacterium sp.]|nr:C39 family peptidase [Phascolarctobacterium sp.]